MTFEDFVGERTIRWRPLGGDGIEHLEVGRVADGVRLRGVVVGAADGAAFGASYELRLDARWRTRSVSVDTAAGRAIRLVADGEGGWWTGDGTALPALAGCIDVDLGASPATNVLPIRRARLVEAGRRETFRMAYVSFPDLAPAPDAQRYTCLEPGRLYLYEAVDGAFSARIEVDADGFPTRYPPLFERAAADHGR